MAEIGSRRPPEWFRSNQSSSTGSSCSHRGMDVSRDCGGEDAVLTRVAVLIVGLAVDVASLGSAAQPAHEPKVSPSA